MITIVTLHREDTIREGIMLTRLENNDYITVTFRSDHASLEDYHMDVPLIEIKRAIEKLSI